MLSTSRPPDPVRVPRRRLRSLTGLLALTLVLATVAGALRSSTDRELFTRFDTPGVPMLGDPGRFQARGWAWLPPSEAGGEAALGILPGQNGLLQFLFFRDPGERVQLDLTLMDGGDLHTRLALQPQDPTDQNRLQPLPLPPPTAVATSITLQMDLTARLGDAHYFYLTIDTTNTANSAIGNAAQPVLRALSIRFSAPSPPLIAWPSLLFFATTAWLGWWVILAALIPRAGAWLRRGPRASTALTAALALSLLASSPVWLKTKAHDDRWALGNASLLAARHFQTGDLFFRSRVRPGFLALALPIQTALPHMIDSISYTPSDFKQRLFYIFDRLGPTWGMRRYPEASAWGLLMGLLGIVLAGRLAWGIDRQAEGRWIRALGTVLITALLLRHILAGAEVSPITLCVTWSLNIAAMGAFLDARRGRAAGHWMLAGGLTGLAILLKESALALVLPIALLQAQAGWTAPPRRRAGLAGRIGLFWGVAAAGPLFYYGAILDGGFGEIGINLRQHVQSMSILSGYEPRGVTGALRTLWQAFGVAGVLAALAIVRQGWRGPQGNPALTVHLCWLAGGATVFMLPYAYPRFLVYLIPPVAWLAADLLAAMGLGARHRLKKLDLGFRSD